MLFRVLGPLEVRAGDGWTGIGAPKWRALLAALLAERGHAVSAGRLADELWGDNPPPGARKLVSGYVVRLRQLIGDPGGQVIVTRSPGYQARVRQADVDASVFEDLLTTGREALGAQNAMQAAKVLGEALTLWRGPALADVPAGPLTALAVERLEELRLAALELRAEADVSCGRAAEAIPGLRRLTAEHPLRERLWLLLMHALQDAGRPAEALEVYAQVREVIAAELGADPGPELQRLHQRLLGAVLLPAAEPPVPGPAAGTAAPTAPRQLPAAPAHFTGRSDELAELAKMARQVPDSSGSVLISDISGMAGVGKTALAIHAAHRLAGEFPDGQLFIDLHGYTQGHKPRPADEALEVFLRALGVPPQWVPPGTDERAAMFRQRLAGTRTMIVLDNAASEAQVRPLVPGSAGCLVLVTSRRRLKGLDEALVLTLDVLPRADAFRLFRAVAGPGRVPPGDPVLPEIVELCAQLPLAVRIAAALLRHRPVWTPEYLARLLRAQQARISALSDGERDLGAVFDLSYRSLTGAEQLAFRCLGLIPGPEFDSYATAALTRTDPPAAARLLEDLVDHNLVIQHVPGRYRLHDLIRLHARALADRDPVPARDAAVDRLIDYYQHTAGRADVLISRVPRLAPVGPAPAHAPALPDADAGQKWLRAERPNLLAALRHVTSHDRHERAVALTASLATLLRDDGPWPEALALHTGAIATARALGDRPGQAAALIQLGIVRNLTGDCPGALDALDQAGQLYRELGDPLGQANALTQFGDINGFVDGFPGAVGHLDQALRLYQQLGNTLGQANVLARLGNLRRYTGDFPGAIPVLKQALRLYQQLGDHNGQGSTWIAIGNARRLTGDLTGAGQNLQEALRLYERLDCQLGRANALSELGELRRLGGDYPDAARYLEQGLRIYQDLGNRLGQANAQVWLGSLRQSTGDLPGAVQLLQAAVDTFRRIGSHGSEAWALNRYAAAISATGDHEHAEHLYREALRLARATRQCDDEAYALEGSGGCHLRRGETEAGAAHLKQALGIFQRLAMQPDAGRVRARLGRLTTQPAEKVVPSPAGRVPWPEVS